MNNYKYQVALSFASEQRDYVEDMANHLGDFGIVFFYDRIEEVERWGKNLAAHFGRIFTQQLLHLPNSSLPAGIHSSRSHLVREIIPATNILFISSPQ